MGGADITGGPDVPAVGVDVVTTASPSDIVPGGCITTVDGPTIGDDSGAATEGAGGGANTDGCAVTTGDEVTIDEVGVADTATDDSAPAVPDNDAAAVASGSLDGGKRNTEPVRVGDGAGSDFADVGCDDGVDDIEVDLLEPAEPDRCPRKKAICVKVYTRTDGQTDRRTDDGRRTIV